MDYDAEILSFGNELLIGRTVNTNAAWLARRLTSIGYNVRRITVVEDDVREIAQVVKESILRKPSLLVTSGGLGPTFDDKTLDGVAAALGLHLKTNKEALNLIRARYRELGLRAKLTSSRAKMARLPSTSTPIANPSGTAPAVFLPFGKSRILCLPGVPKELKAIFQSSAVSFLSRSQNRFYQERLNVRGVIESKLAPILSQVYRKHATVYIKSHPHGMEGGVRPWIELDFSSRARNRKMHVRAAMADLALRLSRLL